MTTARSIDTVPEPCRATARTALLAAFGSSATIDLVPVSGGASGALTYRVDAAGRPYLLRIETRRDAPARNPHQYACMEIAAEAGIAPPLRHVDANAGVVIMDFLPQRPLAAYPGGPGALAGELGRLVARLQATPAFPKLHAFPTVVGHLLEYLRASVFADGLLDAHVEGFERIREAYRVEPSAGVSSHNDPNPHNVIFDGERLWLVDWEAAYRNDPLTDVAILAENFAPDAGLESVLLTSWLGQAPTPLVRARLRLMRQITRVYYAGLLCSVAARAPGQARLTDLSAPTAAEFGAAVAEGKHDPTSPETLRTLARMCLARFLDGLAMPDFEEALAIARAGA